jgi:hypothetical protein
MHSGPPTHTARPPARLHWDDRARLPAAVDQQIITAAAAAAAAVDAGECAPARAGGQSATGAAAAVALVSAVGQRRLARGCGGGVRAGGGSGWARARGKGGRSRQRADCKPAPATTVQATARPRPPFFSAARFVCSCSVASARVCMGACGSTPLTGGRPSRPKSSVCGGEGSVRRGSAREPGPCTNVHKEAANATPPQGCLRPRRARQVKRSCRAGTRPPRAHQQGEEEKVPVVGGWAPEVELRLLRHQRRHVMVKVEEDGDGERRHEGGRDERGRHLRARGRFCGGGWMGAGGGRWRRAQADAAQPRPAPPRPAPPRPAPPRPAPPRPRRPHLPHAGGDGPAVRPHIPGVWRLHAPRHAGHAPDCERDCSPGDEGERAAIVRQRAARPATQQPPAARAARRKAGRKQAGREHERPQAVAQRRGARGGGAVGSGRGDGRRKLRDQALFWEATGSWAPHRAACSQGGPREQSPARAARLPLQFVRQSTTRLNRARRPTLTATCMKSTAMSMPKLSPLNRVNAEIAAHAFPSARSAKSADAQAQTQAAQGRNRAAPSAGCDAAKEYLRTSAGPGGGGGQGRGGGWGASGGVAALPPAARTPAASRPMRGGVGGAGETPPARAAPHSHESIDEDDGLRHAHDQQRLPAQHGLRDAGGGGGDEHVHDRQLAACAGGAEGVVRRAVGAAPSAPACPPPLAGRAPHPCRPPVAGRTRAPAARSPGR